MESTVLETKDTEIFMVGIVIGKTGIEHVFTGVC